MSAAESSTSPSTSALFAALGDPVRLQLVTRLAGGASLSITQMANGLPISRQAVTKHLRVLQSSGLVVGQSSGREQRFAIVPARIGEARDYLDDIAAQWDAALGRLRDFVER